jgi:signal transduction histidine kinase
LAILFRFVTIGFLFLIGINLIYSQNIKSYTKENGLPSLHLYNIVEDSRGFLWIASDNGLSRYDGKEFYTYSILEGLPSKEVIQVGIDETGTIWANCIGYPPSYLNSKTNRFYQVAFSHGGFLDNGYSYFLTRNQKELYYSATKSYKLNKDKATELNLKYIPIKTRSGNNKLTAPQTTSNLFLPYKISVSNSNNKREFSFKKVNAIYDGQSNVLFYSSEKSEKLYRLDFSKTPFYPQLDSVNLSNQAIRLYLNKTFIGIQNTTGFSIFKTSDLTKIYDLSFNKTINDFYLKNNKLWISTPENGLYEINLASQIKNYPSISNTTIQSLDVDDKKIVAGNYTSEIIEHKGDNSSIFSLSPKNLWIRKLILKNKDLYTLSEPFITKNYKEKIYLKNAATNKAISGLKTMTFVNDSILVVGQATGLFLYNLNSKKTTHINNLSGRIYELSKSFKNEFYFIYKDSLLQYNFSSNKLYRHKVKMNFDNETIHKLYRIGEKKLWIATNYGRLILIYNNKEVRSIYNPRHLPTIVNSITGTDSLLFLGGSDFLSILHFDFKNPKNDYSIRNITTNDGLPSNTINELVTYHDTLYIATDKGIASLPNSFWPPYSQIETYLTSFLAQNNSKELDTIYSLLSDENSISMTFSGVGLMNNFKYFEYTVDNTSDWKNLFSQTLNLDLKSGNHTLYIRAIDIHGYKNKISIYKLNIEYPFYQKLYFWIGLIALCFVSFFLWRKFQNQKYLARKMKEQIRLNQQKQQITADLHDDIGASLSSLQINCSVANQLIESDIEKSKSIFKKVETQAERLADNIGDFIWSMHAKEDEFMTLSGRIKTFANEILSATNIKYTIDINPEIDAIFNSSITRKNIVLICKEALNNAVKYSQATELELSFTHVANKLILSIIDNGIGMDLSQINARGIENMKKRAFDIQSVFSIISSLNQGTEIKVIFTSTYN